VTGTVRARPESMRNPKMATGEIEVVAQVLQVLSTAPALPFPIEDDNKANENIRLQYRYLDLRTAALRDRLLVRDKVTWATRQYLHEAGFPEIETPTLIKSTPEGARDFLVPSRVNQGKFYALPQSPQLYKQLLMVGGLDKYFQIARCYRDEDARGDRQPEFTQIDIEMSFVTAEDVYKLVEGLMKRIFRDAVGYDLVTPFPRIPYDEAMDLYGSDKPDLRFGMPMKDFSVFVPGSGFTAFESVLEAGGVVKALVVKGAAEYASRKKIGEWEEAAKVYGAKGLAYLKVIAGPDGKPALDTGVAKFFAPMTEGILRELDATVGDLVLFVADQPKVANASLGAVRLKAGRELGLAKPGTYVFAWVVDFPHVRVQRRREEVGARPPHVHHAPGALSRHLRHRPRSGEGRPVRPGVQRVGTRLGVHPYPRPRHPAARVHHRRLPARGGQGAFRLPPRRLPVRAPAPRRHRPRARPACDDPHPAGEHPRGHRLPQEHLGGEPYGRESDHRRRGSAQGLGDRAAAEEIAGPRIRSMAASIRASRALSNPAGYKKHR